MVVDWAPRLRCPEGQVRGQTWVLELPTEGMGAMDVGSVEYVFAVGDRGGAG